MDERPTEKFLEEGWTDVQKLTPRQRLDGIYKIIQDEKDEKYAVEDYKPVAMYGVGNYALTCDELYYVAKITEVGTNHCDDLGKQIPCYKVIYVGWKKPPTKPRDWVMEYDFAQLQGSFSPLELIAAYYWNVQKLTSKKFKDDKLIGTYSIPEADLADLEKGWRQHTHFPVPGTECLSFREWLGLNDEEDNWDEVPDREALH